MATRAVRSRRVAGEDRFFLTSALVMAALVAFGFSFQLGMGRSSFAAPVLVHVHAVVFMGWVALYVAQTALAVTGSRASHRRLGWIALGWVAAMVVLGVAVTVAMARRGQVPFFFEPAYFLVMNPVAVLTFAGLTGAAVVMRRRTAWHRRLHCCAMAFLIAPAWGRILPMPLLIPHAGWAVFAGVMLVPLAGMIVDLRRNGGVHPAWWWGVVVMAGAQVAMSVIAYSPAGTAIYAAVTAGSAGAAIPPLAFPPPPPIP
jgi:hypothetical protein